MAGTPAGAVLEAGRASDSGGVLRVAGGSVVRRALKAIDVARVLVPATTCRCWRPPWRMPRRPRQVRAAASGPRHDGRGDLIGPLVRTITWRGNADGSADDASDTCRWPMRLPPAAKSMVR
jgi:hypothetical protein